MKVKSNSLIPLGTSEYASLWALDPEQITDAILQAVTSRVRIALVDHITAATALVQPVEEIVRELQKRGIDTMIDGAHALGTIPLNLPTPEEIPLSGYKETDPLQELLFREYGIEVPGMVLGRPSETFIAHFGSAV